MSLSTSSRLLHVDGAAGVAGDMTLGALVDLGVSVDTLRDGLSTLGVSGWDLRAEVTTSHGLRATRVHVELDAARADAAEERSWPEIRDVVERSGLPARVKERSLAVFRRLCEAEATVHGVALERVHLHEAGAVDALVDVCGACLGLDALGWPALSCSPLDLGGGTVTCRHGVLPVPGPATLKLLEGLPTRTSGLEVELTTPTGAALMSTLAGRWGAMPPMVVKRAGYGAGTRTLPDRANVVRFVLGDAAEDGAAPKDAHLVVEADLDDADPQVIGSFCDRARELGALDVVQVACVMKKGRSGVRLSLLCTEATRDRLVDALFEETTTIGCRWHRVLRAECARDVRSVLTPHGPVRVKVARWGGRVVNEKPEHEDCVALARRAGVTPKQVAREALAALAREESGASPTP